MAKKSQRVTPRKHAAQAVEPGQGYSGTGSEADPITITAIPAETLMVNLVGVVYEVCPPKAMMALQMAKSTVQARTGKNTGKQADPLQTLAKLDGWMVAAFQGEVDAVRARLDDPKDLLDIDHIAELMAAVMEESSGHPTM